MNLKNWNMRLRAGTIQLFMAGHDDVSIQESTNRTKSSIRHSEWIRLAMALLMVLPALGAFAQYENGSLVGTIRDSSGAAIPNASVAVTNNATGIVTNVTSNASGDYEVPSLRFGIYTVAAKATGFADAVAKDITITVGGRVRIDLKMTIGAAQTTVEVTGVALQLETESSQRGQTITEYQAQALPLVTRNYADQINLVTGSHMAPAEATTTNLTSLTRAGSYSLNGQRSMYNNFLLDGMDNNAYGESNQGFDNQIIEPAPDAIAQFEVVTNNESAEFGRASAATINVATKAGSNQFHTTLYEFIRNTDLNAAGFIKPIIGTFPFVKPAFNRNQFGAAGGGPIIKNKFFFFLDYEGFRQKMTPTVVETVPTTNEISGILAVPVQDPWSPGTYLPAGTSILSNPDIDPTSKVILGFWKTLLPGKCQANAGSATTGLQANDCPTNAAFTDKSDKGDLRLDYQQSQNSSWFLRISDRKETAINYPALPLPLDMQTVGHIYIHSEQVALGYTHLIGSNKVIDARLAVSGTRAGKASLSVGNTLFPQGDIPGLPTVARVSGGLPSMSVSGGFTGFGRQSTNPQWQDPSEVDPKINISWVKGKQSFKFGFEFQRIWMGYEDSNPLYGSFAFGKGYSVCPATVGGISNATNCPTGTSAVADTYWADFLFGANSNYSLATYWLSLINQNRDSAYAQDDWKVNSKLTLNLGMRWEYGSPWSARDHMVSNFDPATQSVITLYPNYTSSATSVAGSIRPYGGGGGRVYRNTLVNPDLADWGPRLGFAYALSHSIVVRGGYGISYVHYNRSGPADLTNDSAPQDLFVSVTNPSATAGGLGATPGYRRLSAGFPSDLLTNFSAGTDNIVYLPKDTKDSYVESYFLSVQKSLAKNILFDLAFVGNHGVKLQGFINANQMNPSNGFKRPYPQWGGYLYGTTTYNNGDISDALNEFHSRYSGLQARYEQRFVGGLTLLNSFTWSQALDNASSGLEANTPSPQDANNLEADYGQSDYNLPVSNVTSLVYEMPVGHGKHFLGNINGLANAVIGGWEISAVNTLQSGTPFYLIYSPNSANAVSPMLSANYRGANQYRPNRVSGVPLIQGKVKNSTGYIQYVNLAALTLPATKDSSGNLLSPFGNLAKNPARMPAFYETDLDFNKRFVTPIEGLKVEFRSEFYNIFNHSNFYSGGSTVSGTLGGNVSSGGTITGTFEPRVIQFGLKIIY
jgi:hypothetical protein